MGLSESYFTTQESKNKGKQNHLHAFFLSFEVLKYIAVLSGFPSLCIQSQVEYIIQPKALRYLFFPYFLYKFSKSFVIYALGWSAIYI